MMVNVGWNRVKCPNVHLLFSTGLISSDITPLFSLSPLCMTLREGSHFFP